MKRFCYEVVLSAVMIAIATTAASGGDPNAGAPSNAPVRAAPLADTITLTFPGPLGSYEISLSIANGSGVLLDSVVIDGSTIPAPLTWDAFGTFGGPATLDSLTGVDTEIVTAFFSGFEPGETCTFSGPHGGIDPDFTGVSNSGVTVKDIAGTTCTLSASGLHGAGTFEVVGRDVVATIDVVALLSVESLSWGGVKSVYR